MVATNIKQITNVKFNEKLPHFLIHFIIFFKAKDLSNNNQVEIQILSKKINHTTK